MIVAVDEKGVLCTQLLGSITADNIVLLERDIETARAIVKEEYQKRGIQFKSLIDLSGFDGTYVPKAISALAAYMKGNKPFVFRSATFGGKEMTNLAANIVATIAGRDNLMFFKTKQEAEAWLNQSDTATLSITQPDKTTSI